MTSNETLSISVNYRGTTHPLSLSPDSTLHSLQLHLQQLTGVAPPLQKLLYKGQKKHATDSASLLGVGFKNGSKIQMLGSTQDEINALTAVESERAGRDKIMRERALKPQVKVRSTGSSSSQALNYRFHHLEPLHYLPKPESAMALLTRLSNDPAIRHVMQKHRFTVGTLSELAPHEHPELLGLNKNGGEAIFLRLRTDAYDGFRLYKDVRRVLCHELTHNVHGPHDNQFKELNSQLNREVAEHERAALDGTHYLSGVNEVYEPSSHLEAEAQSHVLGGNSISPIFNEPVEERRRRLLEAAMNRASKQEEELEDRCGTTIE